MLWFKRHNNGIVIISQSSGSATTRCVNCNWILFLILSLPPVGFGESAHRLNCRVMATPPPRGSCLLHQFLLHSWHPHHCRCSCVSLSHTDTQTHTHTHTHTGSGDWGCFSHLDLKADTTIHPLNYSPHLRGSGERVIFTKSEEETWHWFPGACFQVLCQHVMCFGITWSPTLNGKEVHVGLSPRAGHVLELEKRCVDFLGRACEPSGGGGGGIHSYLPPDYF